MNVKLAVIALAVGVVIILVLGIFAYETFFPHSVTTTLTGYNPDQGNFIAASGGQPAR